MQHYFASVEFGARSILNNSFGLVSAGGEDRKWLWVGTCFIVSNEQ